ncbi:MAG TPA: FUSC family protein [Afipia sp.]
MSDSRPFLVRYADPIFALKTFAAAMLALVIALWIDLPRPYWAMATVYITSQPLAGATSSKALYRVLGTIIGAVACVIVIPNFVNAPELFCLVVALWIGLCLYLSLLDGTPRSYMFMLAGYSIAIIGFPAVSTPGTVFDDAVARVEEISLGIICAGLISTTVFPRSVAPAVLTRVETWLATARSVAVDVLTGQGAEEARRVQRLRLATEAVEIETLGVHLAHDRLTDINTVRGLRVLHQHMLMLLPILASINDRIAAFGERLHVDHPGLARLIADTTSWVANDACDKQVARDLIAAIEAQRPSLRVDSPWERIMVVSMMARLRELIELLQDCRTLQRVIATSRNPARVRLTFNRDAGAAPARHRDHALALWSASGAFVTVLLSCAFWIGAGWTDGASAPMMAAVACSFFAAQDDPAKGIRGFGIWSAVAIVIVAIYLFALLPQTTNVELLIAMLAPTFLFIGLLISRPSTSFTGMALGANTATLLALQDTYGADFTSYINSSIAFLVGMIFAVTVTLVARSVGSEWIAQRLVRTGWRDLAVAAERRGNNDRARFIGVALNRLGMLVQRLAVVSESDLRDIDSLSQLRVGLNIIDLRRARHHLMPATLRVIDDTLDAMAGVFRKHRGGPMPTELLERIDSALDRTASDRDPVVRDEALIGLAGIRSGLFPGAAPYAPPLLPRSMAA